MENEQTTELTQTPELAQLMVQLIAELKRMRQDMQLLTDELFRSREAKVAARSKGNYSSAPSSY